MDSVEVLSMERNMNKVIVVNATVKTYDFCIVGETEQEAINRAVEYYNKELEQAKSHSINYPSEYWDGRVKEVTKIVNNGYSIMSWAEYKQAQKAYLLSGELKEVTAEQFDDALNVLPPTHWVTHNNVEMFCMREMYTGTFTSQYAHDKVTDKYYTKMVDVTDRSTWIVELLR